MNLTMAEQETIITYDRKNEECVVYTSNPYDIEYYDGLCKSRPDWIRCVNRTSYSKTYICDKSQARMKPPRVISDEHRSALKHNLT